MTENKRFVYIEYKGADYILDNPNWDLDYIEMLGDTLEAKEIVDLLNELSEENEQLKEIITGQRDAIKNDNKRINEAIGEIKDLKNENEQLKKEKENWKSSACNNANFNDILLNELSIAQEQGYEVSDPFKKLMKKGDDRYD